MLVFNHNQQMFLLGKAQAHKFKSFRCGSPRLS